MKSFRTLLAAAVVSVAALLPVSAFAEPKQNTQTYNFIHVDKDLLILAADDSERSGDVSRQWALMYFPDPITQEGITAQGFWSLSEFNCKTNTVRNLKAQLVDPSGKVLLNLPVGADDAVEKAFSPGTIMASLADSACGRSPAENRLTVEEAASLLVIYDTNVTAQ